jgi:transcriptional regulator with GAF, ATPase, and Fis domain
VIDIILVLRETGAVIGAAAPRLGMPRNTINAKMRKLRISRQDLG